MAEPTDRQQLADSPADYEALLARLVVPADALDQIRRALGGVAWYQPKVLTPEEVAELQERLRLHFAASGTAHRWGTTVGSDPEVWTPDVDVAARAVLDLVCGWFDQRPPAEPAGPPPRMRRPTRRRWPVTWPVMWLAGTAAWGGVWALLFAGIARVFRIDDWPLYWSLPFCMTASAAAFAPVLFWLAQIEARRAARPTGRTAGREEVRHVAKD